MDALGSQNVNMSNDMAYWGIVMDADGFNDFVRPAVRPPGRLSGFDRCLWVRVSVRLCCVVLCCALPFFLFCAVLCCVGLGLC